MEVVMDDRRRSAGPAAPRELPILFHLMDVSRPRSAPHTDQPVPVAEEPAATLPAPAASHPDPSLIAAPLAPETVVAPVANHWDDIQLPQPELSRYRLQPQADVAPPATLQVPVPVAVAASTPPSESPVAVVAESTPEPAAEQPVTPTVATPSNRKSKAPAAEDWFATHGKFIAAAFVLALIATIYLARTNRREVAHEIVTAPVSPLVELEPASPETQPPPHVAAAPAGPLAAPPLAAAPPVSVSAVPATVELHLPSAPQVASSPAADQPIGGDNLFVFPATKKADERVASLPSLPAAQVNPFAPATSQNPAPPTAAVPPVYPVTTSPSLYQNMAAPVPNYAPTLSPPAQPTGFVAPASNFAPQAPAPRANGQISLPGGPQPQAAFSPPAAGVGQPGPYPSQDSIARGPRYERTGPGNY